MAAAQTAWSAVHSVALCARMPTRQCSCVMSGTFLACLSKQAASRCCSSLVHLSLKILQREPCWLPATPTPKAPGCRCAYIVIVAMCCGALISHASLGSSSSTRLPSNAGGEPLQALPGNLGCSLTYGDGKGQVRVEEVLGAHDRFRLSVCCQRRAHNNGWVDDHQAPAALLGAHRPRLPLADCFGPVQWQRQQQQEEEGAGGRGQAFHSA